MSLRIAIITDLHLHLGDQESFGVDTQRNTLAVLQELAKRNPDHLLILGDICLKQPEARMYAWTRDQLDKLGISYTLVAGNHDDVSMMAEEFGLTLDGGEHYGRIDLGDYSLLYLDSSQKKISATQLDWLAQQMQSSSAPVQYVLMHHPPVGMDVPYMDDEHSLQNKDEVMKVMHASKVPVVIYCGHYHVEKEARVGNIQICITPSCYFQLDHFAKDFQIDHYNIAYRILDFSEEIVRTSLHYLPGIKKE